MPDAAFEDLAKEYFKKLNSENAHGQASEEGLYPVIEALLEAAVPGVEVEITPKKSKGKGKDRYDKYDFVVYRGHPDRRKKAVGNAIGVVEAKKLGEDLDKHVSSDPDSQFRRYLEQPNFIFTNYLEWRLYRNGKDKPVKTVFVGDMKGTRFNLDPSCLADWRDLVTTFLGASPLPIGTASELAQEMARLARILRAETEAILKSPGDNDDKGKLIAVKTVVADELLGSVTEAQFADNYAQTICYGLFAARLAQPSGFNRASLAAQPPEYNPLLRYFLMSILEGPEHVESLRWIIDQLVELLAAAQMEKIMVNLAAYDTKWREHTFEEWELDPVVYFYEHFLASYDKKMRKKRGVYYTPLPVVSYIVKSVDAILRDSERGFGRKAGLSDGGVNILDPACGTGTFLFETLNRIYQNVKKRGDAYWTEQVQSVLDRVFGFEILMAPYTIAHMKIARFLSDTGRPLRHGERSGIYLTNTLEQPRELAKEGGKFMGIQNLVAKETDAASKVKTQKPIMVVLGNPPYAGESNNPSTVTIKDAAKGKAKKRRTWIGQLLNEPLPNNPAIPDYFHVDGEPLGERNPKWLNDDYVKFLRWGQWRIEQTGEGILAMITNNGFLDNPTFRGMRRSLMKSFSEIYILDLHGNTNKRERRPDGGKDQNVFDIKQGVSISLFVKRNGVPVPGRVFHADLWGERFMVAERPGKYDWLDEHSWLSTKWQEVKPWAPSYFFYPLDTALWEEYQAAPKITECVPTFSAGLVTARDDLTIHFTPAEVKAVVRDVAALSPEVAREKYRLGPDVQDWTVAGAQADIKTSGPDTSRIVPVLYRPFDIRFTYYTGKSRGLICRPRADVMRHLLAGRNLGLVFMRQVALDESLTHFCVTRSMVDNRCFWSNKGGVSLAPLYLYPSSGEHQESFVSPEADWPAGPEGRKPNLSKFFVAQLTGALGLDFISDGRGDLNKTFGPEDVFDYIYAVFHAPIYRDHYAPFLRIDFPRVPLPRGRESFRKLAMPGRELTAYHLMEATDDWPENLAVQGTGRIPGKVGYDSHKRTVFIDEKNNDALRFSPVERESWEFHIGGYQVLDKWLKDRAKARVEIDVSTYGRIIQAINRTRELMAEIDPIFREMMGITD